MVDSRLVLVFEDGKIESELRVFVPGDVRDMEL